MKIYFYIELINHGLTNITNINFYGVVSLWHSVITKRQGQQVKLIITNKNKQGAVVHITNDKQRIEAIKQRAKSKGDRVKVQQ